MDAKPLKVLIVDDEEGIIDFSQKILRLNGFETFTAIEGDQAVGLFKEHRPQICILDVQLNFSRLSGIEVLQEVKRIDPSTKCIMITRITEEYAVRQSTELGAEYYLLKPLDTKEWLDVVKEVARTITS